MNFAQLPATTHLPSDDRQEAINRHDYPQLRKYGVVAQVVHKLAKTIFPLYMADSKQGGDHHYKKELFISSRTRIDEAN